MPLEMFANNSPDVLVYLINALWLLAGLCGVVLTIALTFCGVTAREAKRENTTVPELYQFGASKPREGAGTHQFRPALT